jgi:hypothetical protein
LKARAAIENIEEVQALMMPLEDKSIKTPGQLTLALPAARSNLPVCAKFPSQDKFELRPCYFVGGAGLTGLT